MSILNTIIVVGTAWFVCQVNNFKINEQEFHIIKDHLVEAAKHLPYLIYRGP